jgi:hypothetical protein
VSFAGQPAQPFRAQTGYGGLLPIAGRPHILIAIG